VKWKNVEYEVVAGDGWIKGFSSLSVKLVHNCFDNCKAMNPSIV
jgi:hypothetical protein